jgi:hypothetical protein
LLADLRAEVERLKSQQALLKAPSHSVFVVERFSILQEMCGAWVFVAAFDEESEAHFWLTKKVLDEEEARVVQPIVDVAVRALVSERMTRRLKEEFRVREVTVGTNAEH